MVTITFKNVGQGDSIILEYENAGVPSLGIIDCNLYNSVNPVLQHIIDNEIKEIEFMLLSHPHMDHFSGFYELLKHCVENKINVKRFLHTSQNNPEFLKGASKSLEADRELHKLFSYLRELMSDEFLELYFVQDNPDIKIPLGPEYYMEIIAPSSIELDKYINGVPYPFDEEAGTGNPNANWLSTVLKIYNKDSAVILTSDVESTTLTRLGNKKKGRIGRDKIILAQAPHHGSKKNLNKTFWKLRKRYEHTPIIISVGTNGYNHPSGEVVSFFNSDANYQIYSTNKIGALSSLDRTGETIITICDLFGDDENIETSSLYDGEKKFQIIGGELTWVYK